MTDRPQPDQGGKFPFIDDADTAGHAAEGDPTTADVETRRKAYDDYVAKETPLHETMDHPLTLDPFDENDVEGHMPHCHKCI